MTYAQIVSDFLNNPRDVSTAPQRNSTPKWFHVTAVGGSLYISNAKFHKLSCRITVSRKLNEKEYEQMLDYYHQRLARENISQTVASFTINSSYWYGIFNELGL